MSSSSHEICSNPRSSMPYRPLQMSIMALSISSGEKDARNPRRPVLMPSIGICLWPTICATLRNVPSPPMHTAMSAVKSSSWIISSGMISKFKSPVMKS